MQGKGITIIAVTISLRFVLHGENPEYNVIKIYFTLIIHRSLALLKPAIHVLLN